MRNTFGDEFTIKEIETIARKIRALSAQQIDALWKSCGWSELDIGDKKALPDFRIENIKKSQHHAQQEALNLLLETPRKEVLDHLAGISSNGHYRMNCSG